MKNLKEWWTSRTESEETPKLYNVLEAVRVTDPNRTIDDLDRRIMKLSEETGEANNAFLCVTSDKNSKNKTWDDFREEAVDSAIMGLDLALTELPIDEGKTQEEIVEAVEKMFKLKLEKWSKQLLGDDVITRINDTE